MNFITISSIYTYLIMNYKVLASYLIMLILFIFFLSIEFFDGVTFLSVFIPAIVSFIVALTDSREYNANIKIMSICYDYMHQKEGISIDDILGILISNKYRSKLRHSVYNFFDILQEKCGNSSVEERRRIAEAIPMLHKLSRYRTREILLKLRDDYDDIYHDDNRRRVIEAFRYYKKVDYFTVKRMLNVHEGDSIYTIIAIIEIIIFTDIICKKNKELELKRLKNSIHEKKMFSTSQEEFIDEAIIFYNKISKINTDDEIENLFLEYMDIFEKAKPYMRILIAKNIINICPYHRQCKKKNRCLNDSNKKVVIEFFDLCFANEKNVRRPMAKEDVCYCLIRMMEFQEVQKNAKERIMKMIKDNDEIIPITVFDYIYDIYDKDIGLYKEIINYCINLPENSPLKIRAKHVMSNVKIL